MGISGQNLRTVIQDRGATLTVAPVELIPVSKMIAPWLIPPLFILTVAYFAGAPARGVIAFAAVALIGPVILYYFPSRKLVFDFDRMQYFAVNSRSGKEIKIYRCIFY